MQINKQEISIYYDNKEIHNKIFFLAVLYILGIVLTYQNGKSNWDRTIKRLHYWAIYLKDFLLWDSRRKFRISHQRYSVKKMFLRISKYLQKNICVGVCFNKIAVLNACNFIIKRLQHRCIFVNIAKCLRTSFFVEHL